MNPDHDPYRCNDLDTGRDPGPLLGVVACMASAVLVGFILVVLCKAAFG
jgi:hypothetical protein